MINLNDARNLTMAVPLMLEICLTSLMALFWNFPMVICNFPLVSPAAILALAIPFSATVNRQTLWEVHCLLLQYTNPSPTATESTNLKGEKEYFIYFVKTKFPVAIQWVIDLVHKLQFPYARPVKSSSAAGSLLFLIVFSRSPGFSVFSPGISYRPIKRISDSETVLCAFQIVLFCRIKSFVKHRKT